ncbi:Ferric reductase transmembrane component 5 [Sphaceloma murrayae]|uniref:Ferric reductase transmembrane component 5 n=1 Tax=Sphaceloma murrayae TaxID=2082308 RepID=A0A2K1QYM3_9PEZI|nr:Ferric reductase transmembrane component 5 [Sphaceloma murrayae]
MWHFVDLTDAEKHQRRQTLDHYALLAQASLLIPLLLLTIPNLASRLRTRTRSRSDTRPSSPYLKHASTRPPVLPLPTTPQITHFLSSPSPLPGPLRSTNATLLLSLLHSLSLLYLSTTATGPDYLHLTKRLALVAASQLPFLYLLSLKTPWSPLVLLTGLSWESLNEAHRALGRIVSFLFLGHTVLYLNFFVRVGVLGKRIRDWDVVWGLLAVGMYLGMGATALRAVRERWYALFVGVHVVVAAGVLGAMWAHVSHVRVFVYEAGVVWVAHGLARWSGTERLKGRVREVGKELVEVVVEREQWQGRWGLGHGWRPGQHLYLAMDGGGWPGAVGRNPFSISSVQEDGEVRCVMKVMGGNTRKLLAVRGEEKTMRVEGPYGRSDHLQELLGCDRVLFIAGGVGATFVLPLLRALIKDGGAASPARRISAIWAVKEMDDVLWALKGLESGNLEGLKEVLTVHCTSADGHPHSRRARGAESHPPNDADEDTQSTEGIEMQSLLATQTKDENELSDTLHGFTIQQGRPNLREVVDGAFSHSNVEKVAVYVCGPGGMGDRARIEVGSHIARGRDVVFWHEEFGLG